MSPKTTRERFSGWRAWVARAIPGSVTTPKSIPFMWIRMMTGRGVGRALLAGAFAALSERGHARCVIWAHAGNPARFFYEAMGGKLIAERTTSMMGVPVPEIAFGWTKLALAEASRSN